MHFVVFRNFTLLINHPKYLTITLNVTFGDSPCICNKNVFNLIGFYSNKCIHKFLKKLLRVFNSGSAWVLERTMINNFITKNTTMLFGEREIPKM